MPSLLSPLYSVCDHSPWTHTFKVGLSSSVNLPGNTLLDTHREGHFLSDPKRSLIYSEDLPGQQGSSVHASSSLTPRQALLRGFFLIPTAPPYEEGSQGVEWL